MLFCLCLMEIPFRWCNLVFIFGSQFGFFKVLVFSLFLRVRIEKGRASCIHVFLEFNKTLNFLMEWSNGDMGILSLCWWGLLLSFFFFFFLLLLACKPRNKNFGNGSLIYKYDGVKFVVQGVVHISVIWFLAP